MQVEIEKVKQLRKETAVGVMDAKEALEEADGNLEKARELLHKRGMQQAGKRADREARSGIIYSYIHGEGRVGVLLELNSETSFVAKTDEFKELAHELALQITSMAPQDREDLLEQEYIRDSSQTVGDLVKRLSAQTGEKIILGRFTRYELGANLDD